MALYGRPLVFDTEADMHGLGSGELGVPAMLVGGVLVIALAALALHLLFPARRKRPARRMALTKMAKLCPACQGKLIQTERHGQQFEVCPDCRGAWLSLDRLDQLLP